MFSSLERMIAWRYLRAKKQESTVSVIAGFSFAGILLGVATLIIVLAVMNGFRIQLFDRLIGLNGHLVVYSSSGRIDDYQFMENRLQQIDGINLSIPLIETQALMRARGQANGVVVRGLRAQDFAQKPVLGNAIVRQLSKSEVQSQLNDQSKSQDFKGWDLGGDGVAIGVEMASRLGLQLGDSITLISAKGKSTPFGTIPKSRAYEIKAIFDVGMYEYNNNFVYLSLDAVQKFVGFTGGQAASLQIFSPNPDDLNALKSAIYDIFGPSVQVYSWRDINGSFANALEVERNVMFLILTLIILVAAFNIISSMIMLVKDKSHDIAILRTMGASQRSMLKIFILTGATIGVVGTIFGAILGVTFALNIESIRQALQYLTGTELFAGEIYFLSQLPAEIKWGDVVYVMAMSFTLSILATIYPAWRAARLNPVDALRYE